MCPALVLAPIFWTLSSSLPPDVSLDDLHNFPFTYQQACMCDELARDDTTYWDTLFKAAFANFPRDCERRANAKRCSEAAWEAWWCLKIAMNAFEDYQYRIEQLRELRERIGWSNYYQGRMPYPLPIYCYREIP